MYIDQLYELLSRMAVGSGLSCHADEWRLSLSSLACSCLVSVAVGGGSASHTLSCIVSLLAAPSAYSNQLIRVSCCQHSDVAVRLIVFKQNFPYTCSLYENFSSLHIKVVFQRENIFYKIREVASLRK